MTQQSSNLLSTFVGHVMAGEFDRLDDLLHPNFTLIHASTVPYAGTYKGATGFQEFLALFTNSYDGLEMQTGETFTAPSGSLVVEIHLRGTLKSDGGLVDTTMLEKWDFADGKILTIKPHYFDPNPIS